MIKLRWLVYFKKQWLPPLDRRAGAKAMECTVRKEVLQYSDQKDPHNNDLPIWKDVPTVNEKDLENLGIHGFNEGSGRRWNTTGEVKSFKG